MRERATEKKKKKEKADIGDIHTTRSVSKMSNIGSDTVTINHDLDGESQVTWAVCIISFACTISTAAVVLRIYTRLCILHIFGSDDVVMGISQILSLAAALTIGLGKEFPILPLLRLSQDPHPVMPTALTRPTAILFDSLMLLLLPSRDKVGPGPSQMDDEGL